jgi:hypothetical protein
VFGRAPPANELRAATQENRLETGSSPSSNGFDGFSRWFQSAALSGKDPAPLIISSDQGAFQGKIEVVQAGDARPDAPPPSADKNVTIWKC